MSCSPASFPAVSDEAAKAIRQTIRRWRIHLWSGKPLTDIAREINLIVRGWINYYGRFYPYHVGPIPQTHRRVSGALGNAEVQATERPPQAGLGVPGGRVRHASQSSLLTGEWYEPTAGRWEPYESRGSRTVLREPGAAIAPGHSPRSGKPEVVAWQGCGVSPCRAIASCGNTRAWWEVGAGVSSYATASYCSKRSVACRHFLSSGLRF